MSQEDYLRAALLTCSDALLCTPNMSDEQRDVLITVMRRAAVEETLTTEFEREIFQTLLDAKIRVTLPFDPERWREFTA